MENKKNYYGTKAKDALNSKKSHTSRKLKNSQFVKDLKKLTGNNKKLMLALFLGSNILIGVKLSGAITNINNIIKEKTQNEHNSISQDLSEDNFKPYSYKSGLIEYDSFNVISDYPTKIYDSLNLSPDQIIKYMYPGETFYADTENIQSLEDNTILAPIQYFDEASQSYISGWTEFHPTLIEKKHDDDFVYTLDGNVLYTDNKKILNNDESPVLLKSNPREESNNIEAIPDESIVSVIDLSKTTLPINEDWNYIIYKNAQTQTNRIGWVNANYVADLDAEKYDSRFTTLQLKPTDITGISNYIHSWENQALYSYTHNNSENYVYEDNYYINNYTTKDGKNYVCYTDSSDTYNYGFGVMIHDGFDENTQVAKEFKKYGIDITDPQYRKLGESQLPVEIVDKVSEKYIENTLETIDKIATEKNINFTTGQLYAMCNIFYQYGQSEYFIRDFIETFEKYGINEETKAEYTNTNGYPIFLSENGGQTIYNGEEVYRSFSSWKAFKEGNVLMASDTPQVISVNKEKNSITKPSKSQENKETSNINYDDYER